jgi:phenylacetate-CoA ligase
MLIVRGVNVFPSAVRDVVSGFVPAVSGHVLLRPRSSGARQDPPLPLRVELGRGADADPALAERVSARLRDVLAVRFDVELVPWGTLARSEYKSALVEPPE